MSSTPTPDAGTEPIPAVAQHLSALIAVPTVTSPDPAGAAPKRFDELHAVMTQQWPLIHEKLERESPVGHALLLRWPGADPTLAPVVLMAHQDTVPVPGVPLPVTDTDTMPEGWSHPPFAGTVADGAVWGRGALDDKGALTCLLEAVESLLADGVTPTRDIYLALGDDEEITGNAGAPTIAALLTERGIRPWMVVDEGGAVVQGMLPGVTRPTGVIGVAEKGVTDLELVARAAGGHASTPQRGGAVARLARAITRIDAHPFPARLPEPVVAMFTTVGPEVAGPLGAMFRNAERLAPVLAPILTRSSASMNSMLRTTAAVTMLQGSPGRNVLATEARATVNVRISVDSSLAEMLKELAAIIDDPSIEIRVVEGGEPSPISPHTGPQWDALTGALGASYPEAVALPYVQTGASDSRFFTGICDNVYRFTPFLVSDQQLAGLHGIDENLSVSSLEAGVAFYRALIAGLPSV